jgi:hypothetical protein
VTDKLQELCLCTAKLKIVDTCNSPAVYKHTLAFLNVSDHRTLWWSREIPSFVT